MKARTFLLIIIRLILLISCTPQKRLARLLNQHPELVTYSTDSIYIDTILIVPGKEVSISIPVNFDSIISQVNGFTFDFVKVNDTIKVKVTTPVDSIIYHYTAPVPIKILNLPCENKKGLSSLNWFGIGVGVGFLVMFLITIFIKLL